MLQNIHAFTYAFRERERETPHLHDGEGITWSGSLGKTDSRGVVNFGDGLCRGRRPPWGVLLKRSCSSFSGHACCRHRLRLSCSFLLLWLDCDTKRYKGEAIGDEGMDGSVPCRGIADEERDEVNVVLWTEGVLLFFSPHFFFFLP